MILYHQTTNSFNEFDLSKARPGAFGVGVYFYTEKPTEAGVCGIICDVQLSNPMREGEKLVADEKWDEMSRVVEQLILRDGYVAHDFVMCFDADEIAIVGKF